MTIRWEGKPVAQRLLATARSDVESGTRDGLPMPVLASVHRDAPTPFRFYLQQQARAAGQAGIAFRPIKVGADADRTSIRAAIEELDRDAGVHAILLEHPLPPELDYAGAVSAIRVDKDVDGVTVPSLGQLALGRPVQVPAVARAALAIPHYYGTTTEGHHAAVVGRSETVGLPLALMLLHRGRGGNATVTIAHSKTSDLRGALSRAEVVFSCAGQPGLLTREVVPEGAAVVDVGLSSVPDPTKPGGIRSAGDADAASLDGWASALTPVPGGVGPVTVAELMSNVVRAWKRQEAAPSG